MDTQMPLTDSPTQPPAHLLSLTKWNAVEKKFRPRSQNAIKQRVFDRIYNIEKRKHVSYCMGEFLVLTRSKLFGFVLMIICWPHKAADPKAKAAEGGVVRVSYLGLPKEIFGRVCATSWGAGILFNMLCASVQSFSYFLIGEYVHQIIM